MPNLIDTRFRIKDEMNFDVHASSSRGQVDMHRALAASERAELVHRLVEADLAFIFRHALVQDTAYSSLMKHDRKRLHRVVAEQIENAYPDALDENAARLAQHYAEAGEDAKTAEYATRAGDAAARVFAHPEARVQYALALEALARLPDDDDTRHRRVDTLIKQVSVSLRTAEPQQSLERLHQAEALLENVDASPSDRARLARLHYWMGHAYIHSNEPGLAIQYMQQVLPIAQELHDPELLAIPASVIGRALAVQGQFARGGTLLREALPALEQVENWHEWIIARAFQGVTLAMRGWIAEALEAGQHALARATTLQTLTGIGQCHVMLALVYWVDDDGQRGLEESALAGDVAKRSGDHLILYLSIGARALAHARCGDYIAAEQDNAEMKTLRKGVGGRLALDLWVGAAHAENLLRLDRIDDSRALAEQIGQEARAINDIFAQGLTQRVLGQANARADANDWQAAEANFATALRLLQEGDAAPEAARTHVVWGKILYERGDSMSAQEHFQKAAAQFEVSGLTREFTETRFLMDTIGALV